MRLYKMARLTALVLLPLGSMAAHAATLNLSDTITYPGSVTVTPSGLPGNATIIPTSTFTLGDTLAGGLAGFPTNLVSGGSSTIPSVYNFYDDYLFSTTGATVSGAVISFDQQGIVGIGHLQARLLRTDGGINPVPTIGPVTGPSLVVDLWTDVSCAPSVNCQIILPKGINPGSYDLQIRGGADSLGGSYGGNLQFTAVPLPAAGWLLVSGLTGLAGFARRRRQNAQNA